VSQVVLVIAGAFAALLGSSVVGWAVASTILVLVATLFLSSSAIYLLIGVALAALVAKFSQRIIPWRFLPFAIYLALGLALIWGRSSIITPAAILLVVAIGSWIVGNLAGSPAGWTINVERWIAIAIVAIVLFELAVGLAQQAGANIFPPGERTEELTAGRVNGTTGHPGTLGKAILLIATLALPLTRSVDVVARRASYLALFGSLVIIGLTISRTNIIAFALLIVIWAVLLPKERKLSARIVLPVSIGIAGLFFLDAILERFAEDPLGGARERFMSVAERMISQHLAFGVGPGNYVTVGGLLDSLTAKGWRVHNVFFLEAAELGVVGAILLFGPMIVLVVRALRILAASPSPSQDFARALVAATLPLTLICITGWGLVNGSILLLWFFVMGVSEGRMKDWQPAFHAPNMKLVAARKIPRREKWGGSK